MWIKLKVLQGSLRHQDGAHAGAEVEVHKDRFVIGSGMDCQMRCPSASISPRHCEITRRQDGYQVRDLSSETGTFVNDQRLTQPQVLQSGDRLRVGRLEFEVVVPEPAPGTPAPPRAVDAVGESISDMLVEADREARAERLMDPAKRSFTMAAPEPKVEEPPAKKKPVLPEKKPPKKLPPPPPIVAPSTVEAAEEVLKKIFDKPKK